MATKLCKTDKGSGSGAARYPLISDGDDLLVIKNAATSGWSNKELVVTPDEEYYSTAVTYGEQSSYNAGMALGYTNPDALEMQTRLKSIRDAKTTESWKEGHKALFAYWARSYPPYRQKADSSMNATQMMNTMELAANFRLLRFQLRALPIGKLSSFSAYWRVWNPSCIHHHDTSGQNTWSATCFTSLHNTDGGKMYYNFSNEIKPPKFHYGSGHGTADIAGAANCSAGNDVTWTYTAPYDVWDDRAAHAYPPSSWPGRNPLRVYVKGSALAGGYDYTPYYADIAITGDGLSSLKEAMKSGGPLWAHCGFPIVDVQSATGSFGGQEQISTILVYASRLELRLVATWSRFNN